jgi:adenylosuccinate synthase
MNSLAICGLQWGDEGKGKISDYFAADYNCVVKFNGGDNAGHTLVKQGKKYVLNSLPAASISSPEKSKIILASEAIFNPKNLLDEYDRYHEELKGKELFISESSHVITEFSLMLDEYLEGLLGKQAIGTTKRGVGPTYANRALRIGLRAIDLLDKDTLYCRFSSAIKFYKQILTLKSKTKQSFIDEMVTRYHAYGEKLKDCIRDMVELSEEFLLGKKNSVLYEGCQGSMLDIGYGSYPYVTSSFATLPIIPYSCGAIALLPDRRIGVIKSYITRVGEGPLPTTIEEKFLNKRFIEEGQEYGSTTGRPRRVGWLELPALVKFIKMNGIQELAMTKLDILFSLPMIKVCYDYDSSGKPKYREFINNERVRLNQQDFFELSKCMKEYIAFTEERLSTSITLAGFGSDTESVLVR